MILIENFSHICMSLSMKTHTAGDLLDPPLGIA